MNSVEIDQLHELARLYQLETSFYDGLGTFRQSPPEAILAVLQSMGAPLDSLKDVTDALRQYHSDLDDAFIEPVTVLWQGETGSLGIRANGQPRAQLCITLESGEERRLEVVPAQDFSGEQDTDVQRCFYNLPHDLPTGYHRLEIETEGGEGGTLLIVSPKAAFSPEGARRQWGVFLPLYALSSERNWGAGDFTELGDLVRWTASLGGHFVGTLPLFAAFLQDPLDPSPYAPASRLFWNEFFVDPTQTQEWRNCSGARELFNSSAFQEELLTHRFSSQVDYRGQMKLKRQILETLALEFYKRGEQGLPPFRAFLAADPSVENYATFRATQEQCSLPWSEWPEGTRDGVISERDYQAAARNYHLYVQWVASQQMKAIQQISREEGVGLYLDLPLGVHPDGYDVWCNQTLFAPGASGGAPPDSFFTNGQDWGFRPLLPRQSRLQQHSYFRKILRHMMKHSDLLRIDHVMSMHRLYWVPSGFSAADGVYVHYPWEEFYAILTLESCRQKCVVVGEDLGTVPPAVREKMSCHQVNRMYVSIFEVSPSSDPPVNQAPRRVLASLNTHDTATFAAFWRGLDIEERRSMGLLDDQAYEEEVSERSSLANALLSYFSMEGKRDDPETQQAVLRALLGQLSRSEASFLLVNLEDLWLETASQNVPGTGAERPNWRNKTCRSFERFSADPGLLEILGEIDSLRRGLKDEC